MLNIFNNNNSFQQALTQYIPSITINIKATLHALFDESFPLETREISDIAKFNVSTVSTLLNDVLSAAVAISNELPNFFSSVVVVFIFGKMYSKTDAYGLSNKVLLLLKTILLLNMYTFLMFFGVRAFLLMLPAYYQTKYWLNPVIRSFFLNNELV